CLPAVGEVGDQLLDLAADQRPLIGLGGLPDPALQDLPVYPRAGRAGALLRLGEAPVAAALHLHPPADLPGGEQRLVDLDAVLLDAMGGNGDHQARLGLTLAEAPPGVNGLTRSARATNMAPWRGSTSRTGGTYRCWSPPAREPRRSPSRYRR